MAKASQPLCRAPDGCASGKLTVARIPEVKSSAFKKPYNLLIARGQGRKQPSLWGIVLSQLANQPAGYSFPKEGAGERAHLDSFLIMAQQHSLPHAYPMSPECEFANPSKIYDQNFGEGKAGRDTPSPSFQTAEVTLNEHKFQVFLDVCQFTPDEIAVRTVDNLLEVTAQHPQKVDRHGFISREFTRTYILPLDVDPLSVKATVTHDGILSIEVRRTGKEVKAKVNEVEVTSQGQSERKAGSSGETTDP
ncbi:hypothetical protein Chor_005685 [Crotalus horridus]